MRYPAGRTWDFLFTPSTLFHAQVSAIGCKGLGSGLGFPATTSWDAASGCGTPQFKAILDNLGVQGNFKKKYGGFAGYYDDQAD